MPVCTVQSEQYVEENMASFPIFTFGTRKTFEKYQLCKSICSLKFLILENVYFKTIIYHFIFQATTKIGNINALFKDLPHTVVH